MDFNDPKELADPQLFDDPSYPMFPSYLMILSYSTINCKDFDNPKVYGDTSITDGLVFYSVAAHCAGYLNVQYQK